MSQQYESSIYSKSNPADPVRTEQMSMSSYTVIGILLIGLILVVGSIKYVTRNDEKI